MNGRHDRSGEPGERSRRWGREGRWLAGFLLALLFLPGVATASRVLKEGDPVPEMTLRDLAGEGHALSANRGKAVILCFFNSEQDRSIKALNDIARVFGAFRERNLVAFAVALPDGENLEAVRALQGKLGLPYKVLLDEGRRLFVAMGVTTLPTTLLVDPEGRLALEYPSYGPDFDALLTKRCREVLGLAPEGPANGRAGREGGGPATPEEREADRQLSLAQILYQRGFPARALPEAEKALQKDPALAGAHLLVGQILLEGGKAEAARSHFEAVLEKKPDSAEARVGLGTSFLLSGDLARAEAELSRAVSLGGAPGVALYRLGQVYERRGQGTQALETYRRACEELLKKAGGGD